LPFVLTVSTIESKVISMKTMTCKQMGGPCDASFRGNKADQVIKAQDNHLKVAVASGDEAHESALKSMQDRWKHPVSGMGWYRKTKKAFAALPDD
jgi:hypothetical protein